MWNKTAVLSGVLGLLLISVPSVFGEHDSSEEEYGEKKEIEHGTVICGRGRLILGRTDNTVMSMCNDTVAVVGISDRDVFPADTFPWIVAVQLTPEDGTTIVVPPITINVDTLITGDDGITHLLDLGHTLTVTAGEGDNSPVAVFFSLSSASVETPYHTKYTRRILRDFQYVNLNLKLTGTTSADMPSINIDDSKTTLKAAMAQGFDFTVTASNKGTASLPVLSARDVSYKEYLLQSGYFYTAFIKPYQEGMALTKDECLASDKGPPPIAGMDKIIENEHFKSEADLSTIDLIGKLKGNEEELDISGQYVLFIMIDPLRTAWNEEERCDNFLAIHINSTRSYDSVTPQCDVIINPWTASDMRAIYKRQMFSMEDDGWRVTRKDDWHNDWTEEIRFGRLHVFTNFIQKSTDLTTACPNLPGPKEQLIDMEGSDSSLDDTGLSDLPDLPDLFAEAVVLLGQLKNESIEADNVLQQLEGPLEAILSSTYSTFSLVEKVKHNITLRALNYTVALAEQIQSGNTVNMDMEHDNCHIARELEDARWLHNARRSEIDDHMLVSLAADLSLAVVANPQLICLKNLLRHLMQYADAATDTSDTDTEIPAAFLFDKDTLDEVSPNSIEHCGDTNKCIKKFRRYCKMKHMATWEPLENSKYDICRLYIMKKSAEYVYRALGMVDLLDHFQYDDEKEGRFCGRDHLKPSGGPVRLWKMEEDTTTGKKYLSTGVPNADNTMLAWTKVAVCRCPMCDSSKSEPKSGDEPKSGEENPSPLRRRRRK